MSLNSKRRIVGTHSFARFVVLSLAIGVGQAYAQPATEAKDTGWPQFRGPNVDGVSLETGVFTDRGELGLAVAWKATIGEGMSGVAIASGVAVTMAQSEETIWVIALDTETGEEQWRYKLAPAYYSPDRTFDGPFSTPLITDRAVIALDRGGRLAALDLPTGDLVWSVNLPSELGSRRPYHGYATSPVLFDDTLVVQIGTENAAVAGFDPDTGAQRWTVGADRIAYQTPVPANLNGRRQLVAAGLANVMGIDPDSGEILWEHAHNGNGFTGAWSLVPVAAGADKLFLANKHMSSSLVEISSDGGSIAASELWEQRTIRNSLTVPVYHEGYLYGYSSRFLICADAETGEAVWRSRPPGDGWLILVDGHLVIVTKQGTLHVVTASPEGYQEVATLQLFDDPTWTHPSFADGHIYARSYGEVARVDIRSAAATRLADAEDSRDDLATASPAMGRFARFLDDVARAENKTRIVNRFINSIVQFPFVETDTRVHFIFRGTADDVAIAGDVIGARQEQPMTRVEGTDLFYYTAELDPAARVNYHFVRDFEEITDPRNARITTTMVYGPDMESLFVRDPMSVSWVSMPRWEPPGHLTEPPSDHPRGRLVSHEFESLPLRGNLALHVYLPAGYDDASDERFPVAYYQADGRLRQMELVPRSLDNLLGVEVRPLIAVFVQPARPRMARGLRYLESLASEIVPFIDRTYRTIAKPEGRATIGAGFAGASALRGALIRPDIFGKAAAQSLWMLGDPMKLLSGIKTAAEQPMDVYLEWGMYDMRARHQNWDMRNVARQITEALTERGYTVAGGEVPDGAGWSSWQNRTDRVLASLFPPESSADDDPDDDLDDGPDDHQ